MTSGTIALGHSSATLRPPGEGDIVAERPMPHALSPRQREVATLIAEGLTNKEIAERLGIDNSTVDNHRRAIYNKLGVRNAVELTHRAILYGWVRVKGQRGRPRKPVDPVGGSNNVSTPFPPHD